MHLQLKQVSQALKMVVLILTLSLVLSEDIHFLTSLLTVYVIRLLQFCFLFTDQLPYNFGFTLNLAFALVGCQPMGLISHN